MRQGCCDHQPGCFILQIVHKAKNIIDSVIVLTDRGLSINLSLTILLACSYMNLLQIVQGTSLVVSCRSLVDLTGGQVLNLFQQENQQYLWKEFFLQQWLIIPSLSHVEDENASVVLGISGLAGLNLVLLLIDDSFNKFL